MEVLGYLISNIFRVYIVYKLFGIFFDECKLENKKKLVVYAGYYILNSCIYLLICIPIIIFIVNMISILAISFIYDTTIKQRILAVALQFALMFCIELLIKIILIEVFPAVIQENQTNLTMVQYAIIILLAYPIVLLLEKSKMRRQGEYIPLVYWIVLTFLSVGFIYISLMLSITQSQFKILVSIGVIYLLGINFIVFNLYDMLLNMMPNKLDTVIMNEQKNLYEKQLQFYKELLDETSTMRHDWKNHLAVIKEMAVSNNSEEIIKYVGSLTDTICKHKIYSSSGNAIIDAMINYKCAEAQKCGIQVRLNVKIPCQIEYDERDISTILGNLMDNAILAAANSGDNSYIELRVKEQQEVLSIQIINTYKHELKVSNGIYLTTKDNKSEHGIGLANVKKIVDKHNGLLEIYTKQNKFFVEIILFKLYLEK